MAPGIIVGDISQSKATFLSSTARFVRAVEQFKSEVGAKGSIDEDPELDADIAAHIGGYWNEDSNHVQNGLLLRGDLHSLFDLGKIGVDPNTFTVIVSERRMPTLYGELSGKKIRLPASRAQWPSPQALRDHVKRWKLE